MATNRTQIDSDREHSPFGEQLIDDSPEALHERIKVRAYEIWHEESCPDGRHLENWARAESETLADSRRLRAGHQ